MVLRQFGRKGRLDKANAALWNSVRSAPLIFSAEAIDTYDEINSEAHLEAGEPQYRRFIVSEGATSTASYLSQRLLLIEGVAFFLHYLNRVTFRGGDERLRDAIAEPIGFPVIQMIADMFAAAPEYGEPIPAAAILEHVNSRELEYTSARTVMGATAEDETSVVGMAALLIAEMLDRADNQGVQMAVRVALLRRIEADDWTKLIRAIEIDL